MSRSVPACAPRTVAASELWIPDVLANTASHPAARARLNMYESAMSPVRMSVRTPGRSRADLFRRVDAVGPAEAVVHHHDVHFAGGRDRDGLLLGVGDANDLQIGLPTQDAHKALRHEVAVVDDEDADAVPRTRS